MPSNITLEQSHPFDKLFFATKHFAIAINCQWGGTTTLIAENYHKLPLNSSFSEEMFSRLSAGNKNFGDESLPFEILLNLLTVMLGTDAGHKLLSQSSGQWSVDERKTLSWRWFLIPSSGSLGAKLLRRHESWPVLTHPTWQKEPEKAAQKVAKLFMDNKAH